MEFVSAWLKGLNHGAAGSKAEDPLEARRKELAASLAAREADATEAQAELAAKRAALQRRREAAAAEAAELAMAEERAAAAAAQEQAMLDALAAVAAAAQQRREAARAVEAEELALEAELKRRRARVARRGQEISRSRADTLQRAAQMQEEAGEAAAEPADADALLTQLLDALGAETEAFKWTFDLHARWEMGGADARGESGAARGRVALSDALAETARPAGARVVALLLEMVDLHAAGSLDLGALLARLRLVGYSAVQQEAVTALQAAARMVMADPRGAAHPRYVKPPKEPLQWTGLGPAEVRPHHVRAAQVLQRHARRRVEGGAVAWCGDGHEPSDPAGAAEAAQKPDAQEVERVGRAAPQDAVQVRAAAATAEEEARVSAAEEATRARAATEEAARVRAAAAEEEAARARAAAAEEEAARARAAAAEEEAARVRAAEEAARARAAAAEEEAARVRAAEEAARARAAAAEEEAARVRAAAAEEEAARARAAAAEEEAARVRAAEEAGRVHEEEETARTAAAGPAAAAAAEEEEDVGQVELGSDAYADEGFEDVSAGDVTAASGDGAQESSTSVTGTAGAAMGAAASSGGAPHSGFGDGVGASSGGLGEEDVATGEVSAPYGEQSFEVEEESSESAPADVQSESAQGQSEADAATGEVGAPYGEQSSEFEEESGESAPYREQPLERVRVAGEAHAVVGAEEEASRGAGTAASGSEDGSSDLGAEDAYRREQAATRIQAIARGRRARETAQRPPGAAAATKTQDSGDKARRLLKPLPRAVSPVESLDAAVEAVCAAVHAPAHTWQVEAAELHYGARIGVGNFAEVFDGTLRGKKVALKRFTKDTFSAEDFRAFVSEVKHLTRLRHPNVVGFVGACVERASFCIVTELVPNGNLHAVLKRRDTVIPWPDRVRMAMDVTEAVRFLHAQQPPVLHLDIKSPNLLVGNDLSVKLADFGLAAPEAPAAAAARPASGFQPGTVHPHPPTPTPRY